MGHALVFFLALATVGCADLFSFTSQGADSPARDARRDGAKDQRSLESATDRDARGRDLGPDTCNLPPSPPSRICVDSASNQAARCPGPCVPPDDTDCDGLPFGPRIDRDPQPTIYNAILFGDGFNSDPFTTRWIGATWTCGGTAGRVDYDPAGNSLRLSRCGAAKQTKRCSGAPTLPDKDYLVEMRFKVDGIRLNQKTYRWSITLQTLQEGALTRECKLFGDPKTYGGRPLLQVAAAGSKQMDVKSTLALKKGDSLVLQAWSYLTLSPTIKHVGRCRLLSADGKTLLANASVTSAVGRLNRPGFVSITVRDASISVDHVRIYDIE